MLEGERRSFENVKADLLRRIKMLEFALRQERFVGPRATTVVCLMSNASWLDRVRVDASYSRAKRGGVVAEDTQAVHVVPQTQTQAQPATAAAQRPAAAAAKAPALPSAADEPIGTPNSGSDGTRPAPRKRIIPQTLMHAVAIPSPFILLDPTAAFNVWPSSQGKGKAYTVAVGRGLRGRQILQQYLEQIGQSHSLLAELRQQRAASSATAAAAVAALSTASPTGLPAAGAAGADGGAATASSKETEPPLASEERPSAESLRDINLETTVPPGHHGPASPQLITKVAEAQRHHAPLPIAVLTEGRDSPQPPDATALPEPDERAAPEVAAPFGAAGNTDTIRLPSSVSADAAAALAAKTETGRPAENIATDDESEVRAVQQGVAVRSVACQD